MAEDEPLIIYPVRRIKPQFFYAGVITSRSYTNVPSSVFDHAVCYIFHKRYHVVQIFGGKRCDLCKHCITAADGI